MPSYDPACGDYVPVGVEVRVASQDDVNMNLTCAQLLALKFADCFHRLSQIRVWNDGNANSQPRVPAVTLTGGCGGLADGYFSYLPTASLNCKYDVSVQVNWGTRNQGNTNVQGNFKVSANGTNVPVSTWNPGGVSTYATAGGAITANPGPNPVTISLSWEDNDKNHFWPDAASPCSNKNGNPCKYSGTDGHQAFVGTNTTAGAVALVRTSMAQTVNGVPGAPFDNHRSGGSGFDCNNSDTCAVYPTVGTVGVLKTGVFTTLRLSAGQANQTLHCDPDVPQGQEFDVFKTGCKPWYGANTWASPWWTGTPKDCPDKSQWFSSGTPVMGKNSSGNYWQCVLTAPGLSNGQIGDDIAVATENCGRIQNNSCQQFACNYNGNYDGTQSDPTGGWVQNGGDSRFPRVVNLFIVPYQSSKGLSGADDEIPVLGFASFFVTNWIGANSNQSDLCPDTTWDNDNNPATPQVNLPDPPKGAIQGFFVETVDYEPGPVDPNATCVEGQLTPCRAVLVR
jgi:hypothetical protein